MARILCTVTNDLTYDQRMLRICSSLAQAGYAVELAGRERSFSEPLRETSFRQTRLRCFFNQGKLFYLEYNLRLFFYLLTARFDILCAVDLDTLLPGYLVSRLRGKVLVYDAHEYFSEVPEVANRPLVQKAWETLARSLIPRLRHAYTVGASLAAIFEKKYGTPFAVIRNLPHRREATARPDPDHPPILLYQGYLNEGRGLETALAALPQLPAAELWLAGEGDLSTKLRELAEEMGVKDRVRFLGYLRPEAMQEVTLQATLGLNLLENRGQSYYYSLANKAMDYVQAGLPSIQMEFPEYRRLQEQYAIFHLLPELSEETVVAAIRRLLSDRTYYEKIRRQCLSHRGELCWEKEEEKLLAFYRKVREESSLPKS